MAIKAKTEWSATAKGNGSYKLALNFEFATAVSSEIKFVGCSANGNVSAKVEVLLPSGIKKTVLVEGDVAVALGFCSRSADGTYTVIAGTRKTILWSEDGPTIVGSPTKVKLGTLAADVQLAFHNLPTPELKAAKLLELNAEL